MKAKFTQNLGLKILAVFVASLVWLMVINIADPKKPQLISEVPVEILNAEAITGEGKIFEILDGSDVIDVTAYGSRSLVEALSKSQIKATADMTELSFMDTVEIQLSCTRYDAKDVQLTSKVKNLKVKVEDLASKQLPIEVMATGTPEQGYMTGSSIAEETVVNVSGPVSVISRAVRAEAEVPVDGLSSTLSTSTNIRLYDSKDEEVTSPYITFNINKVKVTVEILRMKEVYLNVQMADTSAEGYGMTGLIETDPTSVKIAGKGTAFNELNVINIPETAIDITGARDTVETTVNIKQFLPSGVQLADNSFDGNITIRVYVAALGEKSVEVPVANITFQNVPDNMSAAISGDVQSIPVKIRGLGSAYDLFDGTAAVGTIDLKNIAESTGGALGAGEYSAVVSFVFPSGITSVATVHADVTVSAATHGVVNENEGEE